MRYAMRLLTLPFRLFDAIMSRFVLPPVDYRADRFELLAQRNVLLEELRSPRRGEWRRLAS